MSAVLPTRWPVSADTSQALGYLLTRHVPIETQPRGARLIRQAAGWLPPEHPRPDRTDMTVARARSWVAAAQQHARLLGPPPDLDRLLTLLADGTIRSGSAARAVLEQAGAGEAANPRVLVDFARWCGGDLPFQAVPLGVRGGRRVHAYTRSVDDLVRARSVVAAAARRQGAIAAGDALDRLTHAHLRIDPVTGEQDLRDLLGVRGSATWWWPHRHVVTPLSATLQRLQALGRAVPVDRVPDAVARARRTGWPTRTADGPLPTDAIRHWVRAHHDWVLTEHDSIRPAGPPADVHPHDRLVIAALPCGHALTWKALQTALIEQGAGASTAAAIIRHSPLLRRTTDGYALVLGDS